MRPPYKFVVNKLLGSETIRKENSVANSNLVQWKNNVKKKEKLGKKMLNLEKNGKKIFLKWKIWEKKSKNGKILKRTHIEYAFSICLLYFLKLYLI